MHKNIRILFTIFSIVTGSATSIGAATTALDTKIVNVENIKDIWNDRAEEWDRYHGAQGEQDPNRVYQSDPVLWEMLKDVNHLTVLDVGCGEGYLSRKLVQRGAFVIAIDISDKLIDIARKKSSLLNIDYRVEDSAEMKTVPSESIDRITCNYVLMDTPRLDDTVKEFYRVLKPGGEVVAIFSHPCFPMETIQKVPNLAISYGWKLPYFIEHVMKLPKWSKFSSGFTIFHRPLSTYWKAFRNAGFEVVDFQEPYLSEEARKKVSQELLEKFSSMPHSVAFLLRKKIVA
jgi:ubiquinone/menaquinone biosynthesis C-methylase UbiE